MNFELGIKDFEYTELKTVERIQYSALSNSDFGENESKTSNQAKSIPIIVDYILILKSNSEVKTAINTNEVESINYISKEEIHNFLSEKRKSQVKKSSTKTGLGIHNTLVWFNCKE